MSVLQVYLSWANSVLNDLGRNVCPGVTSIQEGKVVCQLIDILSPGAGIQRRVESSQNANANGYLRAALDHMRNHGVKFHFTPQDILDGDIKSILDVLWLIILNYAVHSIGSSPYQRSVGIGKKLLLDWCQRELQEEFDPQNSLTYNLCTGDWFLKLLSKNTDRPYDDTIEREVNIKSQLCAIEEKYGIKQKLISPSDITEGTVDEHTLMIYVSLLRLKIGDSVDIPLKSPSELSFQPLDLPLTDVSTTSSENKSRDVPAIVLSEISDDKSQSPETVQQSNFEVEPVISLYGNPSKSSSTTDSSPTQSPRKRSPEGTDQETSDWMSQSSGSPMSSTHEKALEQRTPEVFPETDTFIKETISRHVEEHITSGDDDMSTKVHGSRIPVRVRPGEESQRSSSSPGRIEDENEGARQGVTRKISVRVQRPRSPNSIMAEARLRQEHEKERKKHEKEENERLRKQAEKDEPVMTGSASEGGDYSEIGLRVRHDVESDPIKSDEDDIVKPKSSITSPGFAKMNGHMNGQKNGEIHNGLPVFVMPSQKHDMELLLEALRHARTEANVQDQIMQSAPSDQPDFKQVVDKNIEQLEAQLAAVKAQSKELFDEKVRNPEMDARHNSEMSRGRTPVREPHSSRRGECRSPPRGILDVMANQHIEPEETIPKQMHDRTESPPAHVGMDDMVTPPGILRYRRARSPADHARRFTEGSSEGRVREGSYSPDKWRPLSPHQNVVEEEQNADKRLIKFLTNEIENLKLKMAVVEQKSQQRSQSPYGMGPRITSGLPERERSPSQISSRARARFTDFNSDGSSGYSPTRRCRSSEFLDTPRSRSRSPRFDRSSSRSPSRSPINLYRSRTPERLSRGRTRAISPSAKVLSLQDLSTSIQDDPDGKTTFSPANGAKRVDLGYTSPIRKVNQEIWGHNQTEDEYYADTAKYESWKRLIARDATCDEDMLELKQALASSLVELDILQAKLKNANSDIKLKMGKTTEVMNDCRAHLTKSQAENAELRAQIEREKSKSDAQDLRIKEIEENMLSSKSNQDDKTLDLEESVMTLKGIVNLDKNQMAQLEEENDKLRQKISEFQRENIKLKEDFNELKIYNDKAQTTIKDLKTCLEDARSERKQLVTEIKKLQDKGKINTVSNIVNHYMEKGLYEEAEKDHMTERARSRSVSPQRYERARSTSPVFTRSVTPVRSCSPVRSTSPMRSVGTTFNMSTYTPVSRSQTPTPSSYTYTPVSRSQTPTPSNFNYEDISPLIMSDGHEIYPHRRTQSYIQKYGTADDDIMSPVDLNDPELQELLKPKSKLNYDMDLNDGYTQNDDIGSSKAKRQLLYSPYMDKDFVPKSKQVDGPEKLIKPEPKTPMNYRTPSQRKTSLEEDFESKKFMVALDTAVKETPTQLAQQRFLRELDIVSTGDNTNYSSDRWRSPSKGILKTNKSAQNMSIKENSHPRRSYESRSYSPAIRSSSTYSPNKPSSRSYTPDIARSYSQSSSLNRPYTANTAQSRSYSPGNRSQSPGNVGQRSYSPGTAGNQSYSPGDRYRNGGLRDSGYSTPTQQTGRLRSNSSNDSKEYKRPRTPQSSTHSKLDAKKTSGLLSDEERRYADLLIDKYTRQHLIGIPLASS